ncbi:MAG TPA: response regulator [Pyrinomonadaceae bacterium]|nr:response regulator [Pyrinomonadaceae bacterium]
MKTIVVVEDQTVLATAYRNKFKGEGFTVEVAMDGEAGLELITRIKPDLVLLDLLLPKLNGLDLLKTVRANPALHAMPVIVFSNLTKPRAVEEAWEAGATLVLSKFNTSPKRVLESVNALLAAGSAKVQEVPPVDNGLISSVAAHPVRNGLAQGHILLVEDNSDLNALMAFMLRKAGLLVTGVAGYADALQQISAQSFDLFLLGNNEADGRGSSLCKQLRQSRLDKPIIIYSTAALFSEQQEGLRAGAAAYLVKPEDLFNVGQISTDLLRNQAAKPGIRAA